MSESESPLSFISFEKNQGEIRKLENCSVTH